MRPSRHPDGRNVVAHGAVGSALRTLTGRAALALAALVPVALVTAAMPACSLALDAPNVQCDTTQDCKKRGSAFANSACIDKVCKPAEATRWTCLGQPAEPPATTAKTVNVTMEFYDPVKPTEPVPGIAVRACTRLDVNCESPVSPVVTSDASGRVTLSIAAAFDGYLEMTSASTVPGLWFFSPPPTVDGSFRIGLLTPASFAQIAGAVGAKIESTLGHSFLFALDCERTFGVFAPGVAFKADPSGATTEGFYLNDRLPNKAATETDVSGIGGFANLPPGVVTMRAQVAQSGTAIGSVGVLIRAGHITYAPIAPSN